MKHLLLGVAILFSLGGWSQTLDLEQFENMQPRNIGPGGMSGRVTAIDVVHDNPQVMYAGTASGGLWMSDSGGIDWEPVFDDQPTASIGAVAIQQSNPSVIWVGTGEGNPRNSLNGGFGVYRSLDGGKTWQSMGLEETRHIHRIIIHPNDPNTVYVGAIGSPWGEHPQRGVYKTTDGGKSWKKILSANNKTGVADMVMDPSNPNKIIVALWEHKRDPWFFNSGGEGSGLFITYDGGENWSEKTEEDGLPAGDLGRIGIAIARSKPNVVYALVESKKNALYKSTDGGESWKMINNKSDIGNRPFYYSEIYVDPQNENRVYSIFTYVNVSEDGGKNFTELMPAYGVSNGVHPDHHAWWIHPKDGNFMIDGNDGGLNITRDGGKNWRFVGNIPVAQFYHIAVDNEFPYNVYGGMQDNGSWRGPAYVWRAQGIRNSYWQEISFGDGFDVVPDRDDSRFGWSMSQQGYVSRYDWQTGNNYSVRPTHPDPDVQLRFNWNSAINIDPFDNSTIYFGSQFVHKSTDKGLTWEIISPDLTTNDPEKQKQSESGGLTMDATGAENHTTILVIEPSPLEQNMMWVGTDDGRVHYTTNGGANWTDVSKNIKGLPAGSWIVQIKASNKRKGEALLVANDYRRYNYDAYVYRTKDYGKTWQRIVDNNDVISYTLCVVEDPEEENLLFMGTDDGLYVSINAGGDWVKWTNGFPTVPVKDLVIHPREHDLVIGTFGRAAWVLDDIRPLRALAADAAKAKATLAMFDPATSYLAAYQQPTGSRFGGDALYNGENRSFGAPIRYLINKPAKDEKEEGEAEAGEKVVKWDSITLNIYDGQRLIRTLKQKAPKDNKVNSFTWFLREKGVDRPSRRIRTRNFGEPGGVQVKPGTYRLEMIYGDQTANSEITVKMDPRLDVPPQAIENAYQNGKTLEAMTQTAADAVKQLVESKNIAEEYKSKLSKLDKEAHKEAIDQSKEIVKAIDEVIALYLGKVDERQGITRNPEVTIMQRIGLARQYATSRPAGTTSTETRLMTQARTALQAGLEATNSFFSEKWPEYRQAMEAINTSSFKEVKQFSLQN
ncbi:WD40/YVTN/BNR-like repeat-containing protein [Gilvibacter sp.]|uniref:WD40/YVTN/BNR-like repeat-containing protein n=1 Tax=Gilvibacter sp. TaxID=2729997 RepID=UPI003B51C5B3